MFISLLCLAATCKGANVISFVNARQDVTEGSNCRLLGFDHDAFNPLPIQVEVVVSGGRNNGTGFHSDKVTSGGSTSASFCFLLQPDCDAEGVSSENGARRWSSNLKTRRRCNLGRQLVRFLMTQATRVRVGTVTSFRRLASRSARPPGQITIGIDLSRMPRK